METSKETPKEINLNADKSIKLDETVFEAGKKKIDFESKVFSDGKDVTSDFASPVRPEEVITPEQMMVDAYFNYEGLAPEEEGDLKTLETLLKEHFDIIRASASIEVDNDKVPCFKWFINLSGGPLFIRDLNALDKDPETEKVVTLIQGVPVSLTSMYSTKIINTHRGELLEATRLPSNLIRKMPAFLFLKDPKVKFELDIKKKPYLRDIIRKNRNHEHINEKGEIIKLGYNEHDVVHQNQIIKEREANKKLERGNENVLEGLKPRNEMLK